MENNVLYAVIRKFHGSGVCYNKLFHGSGVCYSKLRMLWFLIIEVGRLMRLFAIRIRLLCIVIFGAQVLWFFFFFSNFSSITFVKKNFVPHCTEALFFFPTFRLFHLY